MKQTFGKLWKFLNTPIGEINPENVNDLASSVKDGSEAIFKLGEIFSKPEVKNLPEVTALLSKTGTLFDVLNSPWAQVISGAVPFLPVATGLLKVYLDVTKKEPTLSQSVALITQAAYLESLKSYLQKNRKLAERLSQNNQNASDIVKKEIKRLDEFELTDTEARKTLIYFPESSLAKIFNQILIKRLQDVSATINQDYLEGVVDKVTADTPKYIEEIILKLDNENFQKLRRLFIWKEDFEKDLSIDTYLEERIATLPQESVFGENFTFNDIYVPLKAKPLDANGKEIYDSQSFILQNWVKEKILDDKEKDKVIVIQAGPGRGKSVFCRMFADKVRQELHPRLTPIFIRLRDKYLGKIDCIF